MCWWQKPFIAFATTATRWNVSEAWPGTYKTQRHSTWAQKQQVEARQKSWSQRSKYRLLLANACKDFQKKQACQVDAFDFGSPFVLVLSCSRILGTIP